MNNEWSTPQALFNVLNDEFHFTCDVCSTDDNAKCAKHYTLADDGLEQKWSGVCWCNPPYGREIPKWVEKAALSNALTVMLLPAKTDTQWFHTFIYRKREVRFLQGRLRFGNADRDAPFGSMIVIFDNRRAMTE